MELNHIIQGDCLEVFKDIPDNYFDVSFADPPFNLLKKYGSYTDNVPEVEYLEWCRKWLAQMVRVTKWSGSIFIHNIPKWLVKYSRFLDDFGLTFRHWISWDAPSSPMGISLQPAHYGILYYVKDPDECKVNELRTFHKRCRSCKKLLKDYGGKKKSIHPFGPLVSDVWTDIHRCKHAKNRDQHPCQLPIHLLERLILLCTDEGDSVFDPFMGCGTTAIAAKRLGRNYFGAEIDGQYIKIAENKLAKENPVCIDGIWASWYLGKIHTARDKDIWDRDNKVFKENWIGLFKNWDELCGDRIKLDYCEVK